MLLSCHNQKVNFVVKLPNWQTAKCFVTLRTQTQSLSLFSGAVLLNVYIFFEFLHYNLQEA